MIHLAMPWALVLAIPAAAVWWRLARIGHGRWLRAALLGLLVLAAAQPQWTHGDGGSDVVLILDRSASMGEAVRAQEGLVRLAGEARGRDDRLAVIACGAVPVVLQGPQATGLPRLADAVIDDQASDLDAALESAAALSAPGRSTRIVLVSDGEATGADPRRSAARLALLGIPADVLPLRRDGGADAAIADLELPGELRQGASFLGAVVLVSDRPEKRNWRVRRGEQQIASGSIALVPGRAVSVAFTDRPPAPGLAAYSVELDDHDDRQPLNNRATGFVRVIPGERVLVIAPGGAPGNVARAIAATGMEVATRSPGSLQLSDLLGCQALVLAGVPAGDLGHGGMLAIARWVQHLGGGLVMTGGRRSFGSGGYYHSPVEPVLPVSLEVRDEHRVLSVAMAIAIDRSGSMAAPTADGRQKIELAAEGAAAAIELLGPHDQIAVFAVDTEPHEVLAMRRVDNPARMAREVLGIQSSGGGIYIYEALEACGAELLKVEAGTRHLLLFADASDSEQHGGIYKQLIADLRKHGITVSVIGMGSDKDCDAALLEDVANLGGGRIAFASDPADIPRLFAQETLLVARNPWIDQRVVPALQAGAGVFQPAFASGPLVAAWPAVPGYNLTYPRPGAQVLAWCPGDPKAPAVAMRQIGSGRSVALPFPCDDADAPEVPAWPGYATLLGSSTRWAVGNGEDAVGALIAHRRGGSAEIRLELDPTRESAWPATPPELLLVSDDPAVQTRPVQMSPLDRGTWTAEVRLPAGRPLVPAVQLGAQTILGPALALPMPAEVAPRRDLPPGSQVLADIAATTGGAQRGDLLGIFANPPSHGTARELAPWLVAAALLVLLLEVAVRRFRISAPRLRLPRWRWKRRAAPVVVAETKPPVVLPAEAPLAVPPPATTEKTKSESEPVAGVLQAMDEIRRRR